MAAKKELLIFALIGFVLGFIIDHLIYNLNFSLTCYALPTFFSLLFTLSYDGKNILRLLGSSLVTALLASIPLINVMVTSSFNPSYHLLCFFVLYPVFCYILHSFHYGIHHENTLCVSYRILFEGLWTTIPLLVFASLFAALANGLIVLAAMLFRTVNHDWLWHFYLINPHVHFISASIWFFIGLALAQQNIQLIYNLRFLLLKMMSGLFPLLALISTIYMFLYIINLSSGYSSVNTLFVLTPLCVLGIIFFNAYFQDGTDPEPTSPWFLWFLKSYRVLLFLITLLVIYNLFKQITVETNTLVSIISLFLFTLTYAISAFLKPEQEVSCIGKGNIITGVFFAVGLFLCNLPYFPINFTISNPKPMGTPINSTGGQGNVTQPAALQ